MKIDCNHFVRTTLQHADKKTSVIPEQKRKYLYGFLTTQYTKQLLRLFGMDAIVRRMCIHAHSRRRVFVPQKHHFCLEPSAFLLEMIRLIFIFVQHEVDAPFP